MADVVLVSMPIVDLERPSLGLSLLKALLTEGGISCRVHYPTFSFAERVGLRMYVNLAAGTRSWQTTLIGESVFSPVAFPEHERSVEETIAPVLPASPHRDRLCAQLRDLRRHARELVFDTAEQIVAARPKIVGCTSTFQQHVASLALLRRIRELDPSIITMMGGANCETVMGRATHRAFPWVDYVVSGEADGLIVPLCQALLDGRSFEARGVMSPRHRSGDGTVTVAGDEDRATFTRLDALPIPDFGDYFDTLATSPLRAAIDVGLPVETSRGCWWGARHHCTFCGLNGGGMAFRSKSPERAADEIIGLSEKHGVPHIEVVDNILDMRYLDTLIPRLTALEPPLNVFYEVKSNLTPTQLATLAAAGVRSMQPGIESLDSRVLSLMNKGARGWQQVLFLRGARQHGIEISWNLLYDFPGEDDAWYHEMAQWLPLLEHLQPPSAVTHIRIDRYSPYFNEADRYGLALHSHPMMTRVYPVDRDTAFDLSYHFSYAGCEKAPQRAGVQAVSAVVATWKTSFFGTNHAELRATAEGDRLRIDDSRACARHTQIFLEGLERRLLEACFDAPPTATLRARIEDDPQPALERLHADGLVLTLDNRHIALPVPASAPVWPYFPPFPGGAVRPERLPAAALAPRGAFERLFLHNEALTPAP